MVPSPVLTDAKEMSPPPLCSNVMLPTPVVSELTVTAFALMLSILMVPLVLSALMVSAVISMSVSVAPPESPIPLTAFRSTVPLIAVSSNPAEPASMTSSPVVTEIAVALALLVESAPRVTLPVAAIVMSPLPASMVAPSDIVMVSPLLPDARPPESESAVTDTPPETDVMLAAAPMLTPSVALISTDPDELEIELPTKSPRITSPSAFPLTTAPAE